jgi:hypothetical protein
MNIGMTCSKISAYGTPVVVWLHVHGEKCDYEMNEEKKILLFLIHLKDAFRVQLKQIQTKLTQSGNSESLVWLPIATSVQMNYYSEKFNKP